MLLHAHFCQYTHAHISTGDKGEQGDKNTFAQKHEIKVFSDSRLVYQAINKLCLIKSLLSSDICTFDAINNCGLSPLYRNRSISKHIIFLQTYVSFSLSLSLSLFTSFLLSSSLSLQQKTPVFGELLQNTA